MELEFETIFILLLIGIIIMLLLKNDLCCNKESFSLDEAMSHNESMNVLKEQEFSMDCCPSMYTNEDGCLCEVDELTEMLKNRGFNHTFSH